MSKFSLKEGVFDTLHMMVNPGELPLGSAGPALAHAKKTHRLPLPPKIDGETDYKIKILDFIGKHDSRNQIPPLFVETGHVGIDIKAAVKTLGKITAQTGNVVFRVYPLEELFYRLHKILEGNKTGELLSTVSAHDVLSRDTFTHFDIGCKFHQMKDANHECCLAKVKSWGFSIASYCLDEEFDVLIAGRHKPIYIATESCDETDDYWGNEVASNFQNMRIGSLETIHRKSVSSLKSSVVSLSSEEVTETAKKTAGLPLCDNEGNVMSTSPAEDVASDIDSKTSVDPTMRLGKMIDQKQRFPFKNRGKSNSGVRGARK